MNIHYRIVRVDPEAHGVVIRYWTDVVTEMDLAGPLNPDGTPQLNSDGYPLACRTDVLMSLYDTPTPSIEEVEKRIMMNAPTDWLKLQEDIKNPDINTKMTELRNMVGETKSFSLDQVLAAKQEMKQLAEKEATLTEAEQLNEAYHTINTLTDSLKVLSEKDPSMVNDLANTLNSIV